MRLVIDERWENPRWEDPPKANLSSPESIAALDFSPGSIQSGSIAMWKGDIPHFYYRLGIEEWQKPFFTLGDLKVQDLDQFLESLGEPRTGLPPGDWLCLIVFVMGWSWACWGAQTVTEDVFVRGVSLLYQSARVCHGRPTPHIGPDQPDLWSAHIDDGFGWCWAPTRQGALERAGAMKSAVGEALEEVGLGWHKDEVGFKLTLVVVYQVS